MVHRMNLPRDTVQCFAAAGAASEPDPKGLGGRRCAAAERSSGGGGGCGGWSAAYEEHGRGCRSLIPFSKAECLFVAFLPGAGCALVAVATELHWAERI